MTLETVALGPGSPKRTTVLGFGCSALIGGRTAAESAGLLEAAFDAGIRHFDVARVYGTGDAEAALGRFAKSRRDEITIATKFGIYPLAQTRSVALAKSIARPVMRRSQSLVRLARRHASHTATSGRFAAEDAQRSLATSLDRLGSTYVDALLLHDCTASDWRQEDLRNTLDQLVAAGQVLGYGTATGFGETQAIFESTAPNPAIAQFDSDVFAANADRLRVNLDGSTAITYGCFRHALPTLRTRLASDRAVAAEWTRALDVDVAAPEELAALLLAHAVRTNREGITLFSSGDPERIRRNVMAVSEDRFERAQLEEFARRVAALEPAA